MAPAAREARHVLSQLPPDTLDSIKAWLTSRGHDLPVSIPLKSIKFWRECFALIDTDGSQTLEARELQAVFQALGRPASLRQVQALVESVAGPGARHLQFADFAQLAMHGAVGGRRHEEMQLHELLHGDNAQAGLGAGGGGPRAVCFGSSGARAVTIGGGGGGGGGRRRRPEKEAPLSWSDFHLLAKAFRRRVVVDGIISGADGWREKVLALSERRARVDPHAAAASAAAVWKQRAQRLHLGAPPAAEPGGCGAAAGEGAPAEEEAGQGGGGSAAPEGSAASDLLGAAISAASMRGDLSGIAVEESSHAAPAPARAASAASRLAGGGGAAAAAREQQAQQGPQRTLTPIVAQLMSRLRSNAAASTASASEQQAAAALRTVSGGLLNRPGSGVTSGLGSHPGSGQQHLASASPLSRAGSAALGASRRRGLGDSFSALPAVVEAGRAPAAAAGGEEAAAALAAGGEEAPAAELEAEHAGLPLGSRPATSGSGSSRLRTCSTNAPGTAGYDWRLTGARMRKAAAASREAVGGGGSGGGGEPTHTPRVIEPSGMSRLCTPTASSAAKTAPPVSRAGHTAPGSGSSGSRSPTAGSRSIHSSGGRALSPREAQREFAGRPVAARQQLRLAAVALMKRQQ